MDQATMMKSLAQVNASPMERAFCELAQFQAAGVAEVEAADCPDQIEGRCALTGGAASCLLVALDDPLWRRVRQSTAMRMEMDPSWTKTD